VNGPVNLVRLMQILDQIDRPDLKYPAFVPPARRTGQAADIFEAIRKSDILLAPPLSVVRAGGELHRARRQRPAGRCDQADRVSHRRAVEMMELLIQAARTARP